MGGWCQLSNNCRGDLVLDIFCIGCLNLKVLPRWVGEKIKEYSQRRNKRMVEETTVEAASLLIRACDTWHSAGGEREEIE